MIALLKYLLIVSVSLLLGSCHDGGDDEVIITLEVNSEQKISSTQGNFNGTLTDNDRFGSAVALIGDLEADGVADIAAGSPFDNDGGIERGAIRILFMNDDGTVDLETKISSTEGNFNGNLEDTDHFGNAIAGIGDLDADGVNDLAVGAPLDDDGGSNRGAVWILFLNADGTVKSEQKISDSFGNLVVDLDDGDQFGTAIATLGDLDGDGITDLAVGAPLDDDDITDSGAVWILFMNIDGTVKSSQKISTAAGLFNGELDSGDAFGRSLVNMGDLDQDGVIDLGAGAPGDDDGGDSRGAIWVLFMNADGTVASHMKISATEVDIDLPLNDADGFGTALGNPGDLDGDGIMDLVAGAPFDDDGNSNSGAIWILFMKRSGEIQDLQKISNTEGVFSNSLDADDNFGSAVAGIGNLDNRRSADLVVSAPFDDDGGPDRGALWILFLEEADSRTECDRSSLIRFLGILNCS